MITEILKLKNEITYDFRIYASPNDELKARFPDWVDYYRLKYAICKVLAPKSILEIGVRYGYSAITFLEAAPDATYLGIDNDSNTFGGAIGAINWAKEITRKYKASFDIGDTQNMKAFPGQFYDLIHIDGQQDGDGTFHDLEMALEKGRYLLVDGFFWSEDNMVSSAYFMKKYSRFIEFAIVIPGYAGELLIKTNDNARDLFSLTKEKKYERLANEYDSTYFMNDCGGYETFTDSSGLELDDRLLAVRLLADPKNNEKILDIGCGRGELSYSLSQSGAQVFGLDYSTDAINIAENTYKTHIGNKLSFIRGDILKTQFDGKFNKIIASDVVEHIEQDSLEKVFNKVSGLLMEEGYFIIHTSPNRLIYDIDYKKKRDVAKDMGLYMPANPRTYYEDLMHINEQTPERLKDTLKKYFGHVVLWVTSLPDISGSLVRDYSNELMSRSRSIFAVCSNSSINKNHVASLISQMKLQEQEINICIESDCKAIEAENGKRFCLPIELKNNGKNRISSFQPYPVHLCYHIMDRERQVVVYDGERTRIKIPVMPNESRQVSVDIVAPKEKGKYILQITLVQEECFWFDSLKGDFNPIEIDLFVL